MGKGLIFGAKHKKNPTPKQNKTKNKIKKQNKNKAKQKKWRPRTPKNI